MPHQLAVSRHALAFIFSGAVHESSIFQYTDYLIGQPLGLQFGFQTCVSAPEAGVASALNDEEELLVRCIAIRAAYGGMAGDIIMLKDFASLWTTRSATRPLCNTGRDSNNIQATLQKYSACAMFEGHVHRSQVNKPLAAKALNIILA